MANGAKETEKILEQMERHLSQIYSRAQKEIGETWKEYMKQADQQISSLQKAYEKAKAAGDQAEIRKSGKALSLAKKDITLKNNHYKEMTRGVAEQLSHVNETAAAYINNQLPRIYSLNYNDVAQGVNSAIKGISFEMVDPNTVKNLATSDKTLLPYKYVNGKKDVRWNTQMVNSEVLQGILQGESMDTIAKRLDTVVGMHAKGSAIRNARTAVNGAENKGRMDMLHDAAEKGVMMHKIWIAAHDDRTREAHEELDGQECEVDEPFENEIGKIMYPGDPDADPSNVYNCRCTLTYKVVGFNGHRL